MILARQAIDHILQVYAEQGPAAARALAPHYGVKPTYIKRLAYKCGVKAKRKGPPPRKRPPYHLDPRWKRALEVGEVVI